MDPISDTESDLDPIESVSISNMKAELRELIRTEFSEMPIEEYEYHMKKMCRYLQRKIDQHHQQQASINYMNSTFGNRIPSSQLANGMNQQTRLQPVCEYPAEPFSGVPQNYGRQFQSRMEFSRFNEPAQVDNPLLSRIIRDQNGRQPPVPNFEPNFNMGNGSRFQNYNSEREHFQEPNQGNQDQMERQQRTLNFESNFHSKNELRPQNDIPERQYNGSLQRTLLQKHNQVTQYQSEREFPASNSEPNFYSGNESRFKNYNPERQHLQKPNQDETSVGPSKGGYSNVSVLSANWPHASLNTTSTAVAHRTLNGTLNGTSLSARLKQFIGMGKSEAKGKAVPLGKAGARSNSLNDSEDSKGEKPGSSQKVTKESEKPKRKAQKKKSDPNLVYSDGKEESAVVTKESEKPKRKAQKKKSDPNLVYSDGKEESAVKARKIKKKEPEKIIAVADVLEANNNSGSIFGDMEDDSLPEIDPAQTAVSCCVSARRLFEKFEGRVTPPTPMLSGFNTSKATVVESEAGDSDGRNNPVVKRMAKANKVNKSKATSSKGPSSPPAKKKLQKGSNDLLAAITTKHTRTPTLVKEVFRGKEKNLSDLSEEDSDLDI